MNKLFKFFLDNSLLIITIVLFSVLSIIHIVIISYPYPLESREGATLQTSIDLIKGINPYSSNNLPEHTNVYGILYSAVSYPILTILGANLSTQRVVSAIFIFLCLYVLYLNLKLLESNKLIVFLLITLFYATLLSYTNPLTRPDSLGLFLFLLGLYLPRRFNYSYPSILASAIIGVLCYFTKSYFLLIYPFLLLYLILFLSIKKAIFYFLISFIIGLISVLFINFTILPNYINLTFFNHTNLKDFNYIHLLKQSAYFVLNFSIIIFISFYILFNKYKETKFFAILNYFKNIKINLSNISKPIILNIIPNENSFYLILSIFIVVYMLGGNLGATMTYFYQLIVPFMLIVTAIVLHKNKKNIRYSSELILASILIFILINNFIPKYFFQLHEVKSKWIMVDNLIESHKNILSNTMTSALMIEKGKKVYDNGQSEFFPYSYNPDKYSFLKNYDDFFLSKTEVDSLWNKTKTEIYSQISDNHFDLIFTGEYSGYDFVVDSMIYDNKYISDTLEMDFPPFSKSYKLIIWQKKRPIY